MLRSRRDTQPEGINGSVKGTRRTPSAAESTDSFLFLFVAFFSSSFATAWTPSTTTSTLTPLVFSPSIPPPPLPPPKKKNSFFQVTASASFSGDLGLDSLDAVELVMALEEEFGFEIPDAEADKLSSTAEAISYLAAHPQAK